MRAHQEALLRKKIGKEGAGETVQTFYEQVFFNTMYTVEGFPQLVLLHFHLDLVLKGITEVIGGVLTR